MLPVSSRPSRGLMVFLLLLGVSFLGYKIWESRQAAFSDTSLQALRTLNYQYQMAVTDLTAHDFSSPSPLVAQLFQANALIPNQNGNAEARGLIVSVENSDRFLLLQPVKAHSDGELEKIADAYARAVPEFESVEMDQDLILSSPLYEWGWPGLGGYSVPVELSSESDVVVNVAVVDSGIDEDHEVFSGVELEEGWNTFTDDSTMYDDVGHGTHVAGIIATYAPGIHLIPYKIVNSKGGKLSNVLEGFSRAIASDVDVINSSFGISNESYALQELVADAEEAGIILVAAAGNNGKDTGFYPAGYAETIAVGSVNEKGEQLPSSNFGNWVDVTSLGYRVRSALPNRRYGYKTGTSQSTAIVSAAVARLLMAGDVEQNLASVLKKLLEEDPKVKDGDLAGLPIVE